MQKKLWLCTLAALCLIASSAMGADPFRSLDKTVKPGDLPKANASLDCSGEIPVALNNVYSGDNTGKPNNVTTYGCSAWNESGGEVVYHLYLATPKMFTANVTTAGCDLDLAVLDACDETNNCLIVADTGVQTNVPLSGDFYFVVDGYSGAECAFDITFTEVAYTPVDFCQYVTPLDCANQQITGNTCNGLNLIKILYACTGYTENGLKYYSIFLQPGGNFTATVTFPSADAALYVFDSCAEPLNCLVGADDGFTGDPETVTYMNNSLVAQTVYLVIDSFGTDSCGDYILDWECNQGVVSVEKTNWGTMKALYR